MARRKISLEWTAAAVGSIALHALWLTHDAKAMHLPKAQPTEVLIAAEALPPPPEAQRLPEPPPELNDKPEPIARSTAARTNAAPHATAPAAAQAGKTLTAPDSPSASDIADFSMVQGEGSVYAGGTTSSIGTSTHAVHGPAATTRDATSRVPAGTAQEAVGGPDRSRQATPNGTDWNCSSLFPADPEAGDYATVRLLVTVLPTGKPKSVVVLRDPGHGFAAAARACALMQTYSAALDRMGTPIAATTPPITVRFTR